MFCQKKNNHAQITSEYAILISIIIAALIGMQFYMKRGVQARLKDAIDYPFKKGVFNTSQYEPGFTNTTRLDVSDEKVKESITKGLAMERKTTAILSSNITQTFGDY